MECSQLKVAVSDTFRSFNFADHYIVWLQVVERKASLVHEFKLAKHLVGNEKDIDI